LRALLILGLTVAGFGIFFGPFRELFALSLNNTLYNHTLLIPFVSAYILWLNRKKFFERMDFAPVPGIILLLFALACLLAAYKIADSADLIDRLFFATLGLVAWVVGAFTWVCGLRALRMSLFPVLFLLFMVPWHSAILGPVVAFLQTGSAFAARQVLTLLNVPVYFEGLFISLPGVTVEVAEQCSGIRSALALMILSTVAGYMYLNSNWRRFMFILAVVPVTLVKNGLRVVTLAMLGAYVDMSYLTDSYVHSSGGKPFMVLGIAMMLPVLWGLRRSERKRREKPGPTEEKGSGMVAARP
jgi:exosortase